MSAILGLITQNNSPVDRLQLGRMQQAMSHWGPDGIGIWLEGPAGLGQLRFFSTAEAHLERLPRYDSRRGFAFTAEGRIDNRQELISQLAQEGDLPDGHLLFAAYCQWGEDAPEHIFGDWAFAAWHPGERRLFLARDQSGNTSLYYYLDAHTIAFASDCRALLALDLAQWEMDEMFLGQVLIAWPEYHGQRTVYKQIKRLPPAHCLSVQPHDQRIRQYWHLEQTAPLKLAKRDDYVAAFREELQRAVKSRLRNPEGKVAATLSGGLDSGSVTVVAARLLAGEGQSLDAFTSVPTSDTRPYQGRRFGDEFPLARATAEFAGNVDLHGISGWRMSPIAAIRWCLEVLQEPFHAAENQYWLWELQETAREKGHSVLLTGQMGNAGISWAGDYRSQPLGFQMQYLGLRTWAREEVKRWVPERLFKMRYQRRLKEKDDFPRTAIHPDFARRTQIWERALDENQKPPSSPLEKRLRVIKPGRSLVGSLHAQKGAAHRLDVRDPTGDARLLAFTLSVPDAIFMDPQSGRDRWLIREAMHGWLPDKVRLNRQRGRQAADLVPRLRETAPEVEATLGHLASGPAAGFVNLPYMRRIWQMVQSEDSNWVFNKAASVLMRGLMAGLFVNNFYP